MTDPIEEARTYLPRPTAYAVGVTCGVLAAIAFDILLAKVGIPLSGRGPGTASQTLELRFAGAWWLMALAAFIGSACVVGALTRLPLPWVRWRMLRWFAGAVLVFALAEVGHAAGEIGAAGGATRVGVTLAALLSCSLMSLFGAYFAAKR